MAQIDSDLSITNDIYLLLCTWFFVALKYFANFISADWYLIFIFLLTFRRYKKKTDIATVQELLGH